MTYIDSSTPHATIHQPKFYKFVPVADITALELAHSMYIIFAPYNQAELYDNAPPAVQRHFRERSPFESVIDIPQSFTQSQKNE